MSEVFLICKVSRGMFSDEAVVELPREGRRQIIFTVPKSNVESDANGNGKLKALLLTRGEEKWAKLPTTYGDTIPVDERDFAQI